MGHHKGPLAGRSRRPQPWHDAGTPLERTNAFRTAPRWAIEVTRHRDGACRADVRLGGLQAATVRDAFDRALVCCDIIATEFVGQEVSCNCHDMIVQRPLTTFEVWGGLALVPLLLMVAEALSQPPKGRGLQDIAPRRN